MVADHIDLRHVTKKISELEKPKCSPFILKALHMLAFHEQRNAVSHLYVAVLPAQLYLSGKWL